MIDTKQLIKAGEEKMVFAIEYLDEQLSHIRAGKANPKILDCVRVMYYGAPVPLSNVATVTVPDARTILITPWEKKIIRDIEKGILDSEVGITPENNGEVIRLGIPPLTEERRRQLVKQCKQEAENAKISVRNARRDAIEALKKSVKSDGVPEDVEKDAEARHPERLSRPHRQQRANQPGQHIAGARRRQRRSSGTVDAPPPVRRGHHRERPLEHRHRMKPLRQRQSEGGPVRDHFDSKSLRQAWKYKQRSTSIQVRKTLVADKAQISDFRLCGGNLPQCWRVSPVRSGKDQIRQFRIRLKRFAVCAAKHQLAFPRLKSSDTQKIMPFRRLRLLFLLGKGKAGAQRNYGGFRFGNTESKQFPLREG